MASEPLHQSFDPSLQGKSGTHIGMGLTFAKAALADTTQNIILVPAAGSTTGFCNTGFVHIVWNAINPGIGKTHLGGIERTPSSENSMTSILVLLFLTIFLGFFRHS